MTTESPADLPVIPSEIYGDREEFARGGLGRILRATDRSMGRVVAIKELLPGGSGTEARFIREALVTARLEHPSIVPVYEAGRWPSGEPFYTMKLVSGRPLRDVVHATRTLAERLALLPHLIDVAEALAYAHSKRVIHRDIKPANVIIGQFGETVVIDWGLAKDLDAAEHHAPAAPGPSEPSGELTRFGEVLGTPAYMAPEQARGHAVDERADVYALGALLYFTLAGTAPHEPTRADVSPVGSTVATRDERVNPAEGTHTDHLTVAAMRTPIPLAVRRPDVPPELVAIVDKAMARDPAQRYPTAKELGEDLKAFQTGRLVSAHRYTAWEHITRWVIKNRVAVVVSGVAAMLLVSGAIIGFMRVQRERDVAEDRARDLILLQARASLSRDPTAAVAWLKTYPRGAEGWEDTRAVAGEARARGVAREVWRLADGPIGAARLAPDGKTLVAVGGDGVVRVLDAGASAWRQLGNIGATGGTAAVSPDGKWVAAGGDDRAVMLFPLAGGAAARRLGEHDDTVLGLDFSPDGQLLASTSVDRTVRVWPVAGGPPAVLRGHELVTTGVSFSPDGRRLATGSEDATLRVWDLAAGAEEKAFRADRSVLEVAFSPDGNRVAAATRSGARVWELASGATRPLGDGRGEAYAVAWGASGQLVTAGVDGLAVWDAALSSPRALLGHEGAVASVDVSRDGATVVSGGADGALRVWPMRPQAGVLLRAGNQPAGTGARPKVRADGLVAAPGNDGTILLARGGFAATTLRGHEGPVREVAFSPDGKQLASYGLDRTVRLWDVASGEGRVVATVPTQAFRLRYSPDGRSLAYTQGYEELDVIDVATGAQVCVLRGRNDSASDFSLDGRHLAFADGYDLMVAELERCTTRKLRSHRGTIFNVAWRPGGGMLASASADRTVGLVTLDGKSDVTLRGHDRETYGLAFSPDGRRLATAGFDGVARLWDVDSAAPLHDLRGHDKVLLFVAFTPDGAAVATSGADDTVRVWDTTSGEMLQRESDTGVGGFAIEPDGEWIVSAGPRGLRRWPLDRRDAIPASAAELAAFLDGATSARIDDDGHVASPAR